MNIFHETSLDQLHALAGKRLETIHAEGEAFTLSLTDKTFKGILAQDRKSITFDPATPAHPGAEFECKGARYIVLAVADRAGCKQCDAAEVVGTAAVYQKTAQHGPGGMTVTLSPVAASVPVLKSEGGTITTLLRYGNLKGAVLKTSSGFMEVTGAHIRGAVVELQLTQYREPQQKALPGGVQRPSWLDTPLTNAPWSSDNSHRGW